MRITTSVKWALIVLLLSTTLLSYAQQTDSTTHIKDLDAVIVAPDHLNKELITVQTLSGPELKKLSVHSVADALRYFAGVQVKDYGGVGGLKTINVRSLGTQHVGIFYDGIELSNAQ